ncbi:Alpha/beta hydrolase family protein [Rhodococcus triatomae]|uniref:Alpha/beta hydrolase family protein n=1 Tax=Rhodococcus triatomae TaxID=300028 RepID=A0A1G8DG88_9NOCA|nr:alpha/beta fold hydrolase [Rhodococcus triatomae]SDH56449.1 Alpha/beta hydrolase family protein [Rhodococcus triatomae]
MAHTSATTGSATKARRGRGDSGDTHPYAVQREVEDLAAVVDAAGGRAHLFGASSGGALALEAAAAGLPVERIAALDADDRDEALRLFMRLACSSDEDIATAEAAPIWPELRTLAPTLRYDAACLSDARRATIEVPGHVPEPVLLGPILASFYTR